ncbi:MAG: heavy-metal-associated domain-containing protein [Treponema sp.]|nr:heavy-metal-associated domain-containing protein [Treponema sp.]
MESVAVYSLLIIVVAVFAIGIFKKIRHGSSCCGTHESTSKKVKVLDKNPHNYPFCYRLTVDGMHCSSCVRNVENALNSIGGVWATVSLEKRSVTVRTKSEMTQKEFMQAINGAGYTLIDFSTDNLIV